MKLDHLVRIMGASGLALALAVTGCSSDSGSPGDEDGSVDGSTLDGGNGDTDGGGNGDTDGGGTGEDGGFVRLDGGGICFLKPCQGKIYECGDCMDNDGDGFVDDKDNNCLGPCDNNEEGLSTGIPGGNEAPCKRDCYFDQDSGGGNDKCAWGLECDPLTPDEDCCDPDVIPDDEECTSSTTMCTDSETQDTDCADFCGRLTPNGCDCFGCCDIRTDANPDQEHWVYIGTEDPDTDEPTCTIEEAEAGNDTCAPCTPVQNNCINTCERCELCLGKTELPDDCFDDPDAGTTDGGTSERCPEGQQPCGLEGDEECPPNTFCKTGCCIDVG